MKQKNLSLKKLQLFLKLFIFALVIACSLQIFTTVANASSVSADKYEVRSINTKSSTIKVNEYAQFTGQVTYDARAWFIPFWATCYFHLDVPYMPFQTPILSDATTKLKNVGSSEVVGGSAWQYYTSFTTYGKTIKSASATARAESWVSSGKGGVGSGKGHDWDGNKILTITTTK